MENIRETGSLIEASKVQGAQVFNNASDNLGSIHDLMIDKRSGVVAYAIMSFGGFLGMGNSYHPLPWSALKYDVRKCGYIVNLDRSRLQGAPSYAIGTEPAWGDRAFEGKIHNFYAVDPYWGGSKPSDQRMSR